VIRRSIIVVRGPGETTRVRTDCAGGSRAYRVLVEGKQNRPIQRGAVGGAPGGRTGPFNRGSRNLLGAGKNSLKEKKKFLVKKVQKESGTLNSLTRRPWVSRGLRRGEGKV